MDWKTFVKIIKITFQNVFMLGGGGVKYYISICYKTEERKKSPSLQRIKRSPLFLY